MNQNETQKIRDDLITVSEFYNARQAELMICPDENVLSEYIKHLRFRNKEKKCCSYVENHLKICPICFQIVNKALVALSHYDLRRKPIVQFSKLNELINIYPFGRNAYLPFKPSARAVAETANVYKTKSDSVEAETIVDNLIVKLKTQKVSGNYVLQITLVDKQIKLPLRDTVVQLLDENSQPVEVHTTDYRGKAKFIEIRNGNYVIQILD